MYYLIVESKEDGKKVKAKLATAGITDVEVVVGTVAAERPLVCPEKNKLRVQCFGNFEVFDMQNKPLKFARKKSKELFAYMIDRSGALIDIDQIRTILWEESEDLDVKKSYTRTLLADIRKTLAAAGCQDALINRRNDYGLEMSKISCDYFDFLYAVKHTATDDEKQKSANRAAIALFNGEYMSQYSWAEGTLGLLGRMAKKAK